MEEVTKDKREVKEEEDQSCYERVNSPKIINAIEKRKLFNYPEKLFPDDRKSQKIIYQEKNKIKHSSPLVKDSVKMPKEKPQHFYKQEKTNYSSKPVYKEKKTHQLQNQNQQVSQQFKRKKLAVYQQKKHSDSLIEDQGSNLTYKVKYQYQRKLFDNQLLIQDESIKFYIAEAANMLNHMEFIKLIGIGQNINKLIVLSQVLAEKFPKLKRINMPTANLVKEIHQPFQRHKKSKEEKNINAILTIQATLKPYELPHSHFGYQQNSIDVQVQKKYSSKDQKKFKNNQKKKYLPKSNNKNKEDSYDERDYR